jgi:GTP cyclohydrolase II
MNFVHTICRAVLGLFSKRRSAASAIAGHVLNRVPAARLPTVLGDFVVTAYQDGAGKEHLIARMGDLSGPPPLVRIHSECLTGDVFGSMRCDCGEQLQEALKQIACEGRGLVVYLRQEGRGIGLANKIRAYALQDQGLDTVEANLHLGFPADGRNYDDAAAMIKDQGLSVVRLLTNNPLKVHGLERCGIQVVERVCFQIEPSPENTAYLKTKATKLGHLLDRSTTAKHLVHVAEAVVTGGHSTLAKSGLTTDPDTQCQLMQSPNTSGDMVQMITGA